MFNFSKFVGRAFSAVKPCLKHMIETIDPFYISFYKRRHNLHRPIPPMNLRVRIGGSRWINEFMHVGLKCANNLDEALFKFYGKHIANHEKILDFGCGCGRIIQYFFWNHLFERAKLYGCDVDVSAIKWMQEHYSKNNFFVNLFEPPLPFEEDFFELIFAYSVFTDLDQDMQFLWLKDIQRVLRPGGIALLTIHGNKAFEIFINSSNVPRSTIDRLKKHKPIKESGFIFEPYEDLATDKRKYPGIGSIYGLSFHSHSYINDYWSNFFEVRGIYSKKDDDFREVVVLEKKEIAYTG